MAPWSQDALGKRVTLHKSVYNSVHLNLHVSNALVSKIHWLVEVEMPYIPDQRIQDIKALGYLSGFCFFLVVVGSGHTFSCFL